MLRVKEVENEVLRSLHELRRLGIEDRCKVVIVMHPEARLYFLRDVNLSHIQRDGNTEKFMGWEILQSSKVSKFRVLLEV